MTSVGRTRNMANTEKSEASEDVEIGNGQTPAEVRPVPPHVLEQARFGILDLFRTELESGNHPLDFKAGRGLHFNRTALHLAAMEGHEETVKFILNDREISREIVNAKDCFGYTPLHLAVRHSRESVVQLLTTSSLVYPDRFLAATSERDDLGLNCGGCTPLHLAAARGHIAIARLLLRQPCQVEFAYDPVNIFAMTWRNSTPLDIARLKKFRGLEDLLEASDLNWLQQERARTATSANAILVGAALVAAAAFSAWLQPPGGMPNPDSNPNPSASSSSASSDRVAHSRFYLFVTCAFAFSVVSLVLGILATMPYTGASLKVNLRLLRRALNLSQYCLLLALVCLIFAFTFARVLVFDKVASRNGYVRGLMVSLPSVATVVIVIYYRYWA